MGSIVESISFNWHVLAHKIAGKPWGKAQVIAVNKFLQINRYTLTFCVIHPIDCQVICLKNDDLLDLQKVKVDSDDSKRFPRNWVKSYFTTSLITKTNSDSFSIQVGSREIFKNEVTALKVTHLDQPYFFNLDGFIQTTEEFPNMINGWIFGIEPFQISELQARLDNTKLNIEYPVFREDTGLAYPDEPNAKTCGIEIELPDNKTDGTLILEYKTESNNWILFHEVSLNNLKDITPEDAPETVAHNTSNELHPLFNIDTIFIEEQKKQKTRLLGWVFLKGGLVPQGIRLRYRDEILIGRYGLDRPDVQQEEAGNPSAFNSGFEFNFSDIPGNPMVSLEIELAKDEWIEIDRRKVSQIKTTYYTDSKIDEEISLVKSSIETAQIGRRYGHDFMIVGWCFSIENHAIEKVRIVTKSATFTAELNDSRKDVFAKHGNEYSNSIKSGFEIPLDNVTRDTKLKFEYLNSKGKWVLFALEDFSKFPVSHFASHNAEKLDYGKWLKKHNDLLRISTTDAKRLNKELSVQPLISIVLPVYNTPERYLKQAIESVQNQYYTNWELCIADDASTDESTIKVLEDFAARDPRIKVVYRETNGHICLASNSALELATGEWIALLDHDDLLTKDALLRVVECMNHDKEVQLFYSDEDKVDEHNKRHDPYFKPAWNRSLLEGQNMLCHLTVVKKELVDRVGRFEEGMQGSQDWDLFLKITETLSDKQIRHIPYTLYHWRAIPGSTALALEEKGYIRKSSKAALNGYCKRNKLNASIEPVAHGHWRIRRHLPDSPPKISIIIPTKDQVEILTQGIDSIRNLTTYTHYEIIIVNNNSEKPETLQKLEELKSEGITVLDYPHPFNFSAINNFAVKHAKSEWVAFLNNDLSIIDGHWLEEMVSQALRPGTGAVGAKLYYPEDCIQHAGVILGINGVAGHSFKYAERGEPGQRNRMNLVQELTAVTAACLLVKKNIFLQVGGFEEEHLGVAFNDIDLCLRLHEAGYHNIWTPFAQLYHHESLSRGDDNRSERKTRVDAEIDYMKQRWGNILRNDPAYNPNLTLEFEDFSFAWPPRLPVHEQS